MTPAPSPAAATAEPAAAATKRPEGAAHQRNPLIAAVVILGMLFAGLVAQSPAGPAPRPPPRSRWPRPSRPARPTAAVTGYVVGQPTRRPPCSGRVHRRHRDRDSPTGRGETSTSRCCTCRSPRATGRPVRPADQPRPDGPGSSSPAADGVLRAWRAEVPDRDEPGGSAHADADATTRPDPHPTPTTPAPPARPAPRCGPRCTRSSRCSTNSPTPRCGSALKDTDQDPDNAPTSSCSTRDARRARPPTAAASTTGTASTSGPSRTATSAPPPAPAPTCTTCARRTSRSTPPAATRTSTPAVSAVGEAPGNLHRRRLVGAAQRGQGRRRPDDHVHGDPLRGRRRLARPGDEQLGQQRLGAADSAGCRCCCSGTGRTRPTPSSSAATSSSTTAGSTTATRSSTTRSGPTAIWG